MAVSAFSYAQANEHAFSGDINDLGSTATTVKCALLASSYTPDQVTHDLWADVSAFEIAGTGYVAGGESLTSKTLTQSSLKTTFDAANTSWSSATLTARYAVVYETGSNVLLTLVDFGQDESCTNGTFEVQWGSSGIFTLTAST